MKTIGLLGGMSWESTATYYRLLNEGIKGLYGGFHSAKILLYSADFAEIEGLQSAGKWQEAANLLAEAASRLEAAGADCMLICTNTMHKVADQVAASIQVPLLHIADATAERIVADGVTTVGLLGTRFTMEETFYRSRLENSYGLKVLIPSAAERKLVHDVIFTELCLGHIVESSRTAYRRIAEDLVRRGAEAVILGCTEISLLLRSEDNGLVLYDTTALHVQRAIREVTAEKY
ncbi:MAG: aspartate/glutamate racemase family protein [Desulfocapsaceae bacterium]|jgi:aspartate racemase|nr:aspartate/glutamate racemase family protein [Desulfocapsaceae bacterium]